MVVTKTCVYGEYYAKISAVHTRILGSFLGVHFVVLVQWIEYGPPKTKIRVRFPYTTFQQKEVCYDSIKRTFRESVL